MYGFLDKIFFYLLLCSILPIFSKIIINLILFPSLFLITINLITQLTAKDTLPVISATLIPNLFNLQKTKYSAEHVKWNIH